MTILITGANRGIGRALFDAYTANGVDAISTARGAAPANRCWRSRTPHPGPQWLVR